MEVIEVTKLSSEVKILTDFVNSLLFNGTRGK